MSDDDEYYEFEEEYLFEDLVPDFVVSNSIPPHRIALSKRRRKRTNLSPRFLPGRTRPILTL